MPDVLQLTHTLDDLSERLGLMAKERLAATVRTLNRTITTGRKDAAQSLQRQFPSLKIAQLKARIKLQRATKDRLEASLTFSGKRFSLYGNFGMQAVASRRNNFGVRFTKMPWRLETVSGEAVSAQMLARAFRNRGRGSRPVVMSRHTRIRTSNEVLVAPGVAQALVERGIREALLRSMRERFSLVFAQEARFRLSKR